MRYIYINTKLCTGCDICSRSCPMGAIDSSESVCSIDYNKCVACGRCFRDCPESAVVLDIPRDEIAELEVDRRRMAKYRERVEFLENENRRLRSSEYDANDDFRVLIQKMPIATIAVNRHGELLHTNSRFLALLDFETREINDVIPGLVGADLKAIVPAEIYELFISSQQNGEDIINQSIVINGKPATISIFNIRKGDVTFAIVRNLMRKDIRGDEIIQRIGSTIDRNMSMIQKIGFLLGEEVSENTKILNSIIKIIESGDDTR